MNRKTISRIGAYVMILSLVLTIFVGAMSVKADTLSTATGQSSSPATAVSESPSSVNPDIDGDGVLNNEDPDIDGDGIDNGVDPDIDGDGIPNSQDGNPTSTNYVDSTPAKDARIDVAFQWGGGILVLAVLGWLVALPYLRKRRGTSSRSVGNRGSKRD
jgi:hypothetical protein